MNRRERLKQHRWEMRELPDLNPAFHEASQTRMQIFDNLPEALRQYANEHGLKKALDKLNDN